MTFTHVFEPIKIGPVEVKNRIMRAGHATGRAHRGIGEDFIAYHAERAKGGCGLTVLEAGSVHPSTVTTLSLYDESTVSGYERLVAACRPYGMKIFQQLYHGGANFVAHSGPPFAVSTMTSNTGVVGQPMNNDEILELVAAFTQCAVNAREGGLDGVELHGSHGYLISQFLSPIFNTRDDHWGGDAERRMNFLRETLRSIRKEVGRDIAVGVRLSGTDAPGGITDGELNKVVLALQAENLIDYASISRGDYYRVATQVGGMDEPSGYELPSARRILDGATITRMVTGRFMTVEEADQVIRDGDADLVSLVRAQIADPFLVSKSMAGKIEDVRPCIGCNQGCLGNLLRTGGLYSGLADCLVNPTAGYEAQLSEDLIAPAPVLKKVLIIGGGPAGMEAARVAALQGHSVKLVEASSDLGGMINVAVRAPHLQTVGDIAYWLEKEVYKLGVDIRLNTFMDSADIAEDDADVIIVATGSYPRMDGVSFTNPGEPARGVHQAHVISSIDLLMEPSRSLGKSAVVLDTVGHFEAIGVCEYLLKKGLAVTLVTPLASSFPYTQTTFRDVSALERFYGLGEYTELVRHHLVEIKASSCVVRPSQAPDRLREIEADTVVLITQNQPARELHDALKTTNRRSFVIGDAKSPRDIQFAIMEGHRVARALAVQNC